MALDDQRDANKLFDVLAGGYDLSIRLQALLSSPLDIRGQQAAMAFSLELSRVFKESMSLLNCSTVTTVAKTNSAAGALGIPARDKRIRIDTGEVVTPFKKSREEGVTRKEITPTPHKDGYEWRKYGQKNIQNCKFVRYYFKCNRDRRCEAKKKVQQQDDRRRDLLLPPLFEVTYVNEHTCHVLRANDDAAAARYRTMSSSPRRTTTNHFRAFGVVDTARNDDEMLPPRFVGGSAEENEAIVSCLTAVIGGALPPPAAAEASARDPAAASSACYVPPQQQAAGHSAADDDGAAMMVTMMMAESSDTGFPWDRLCCPADEADDMHVDIVARFADTTVWPQQTCGAWR
ncbi:hypothetical protein BS78_03G318400 [Paspalum vaginatum]|nr:hypothetical protein BS78_03G318400 [Paspalum vaginatum]